MHKQSIQEKGFTVLPPVYDAAAGGRNRRVLHIEFSNNELPAPLQWSERINID